MKISPNTLRLEDERIDALVKRIEDNFRPSPILPSDSIEKIMYQAGQASVIEYIKNQLKDE
ncbi:MAG: hypothetical protein CL815_02140 [Coraliomargarita sp.]|jgi:hypothetical protein|nr:hypothetical protein [Coraliomargarita sp.]|tara:strand:- start:1566 stop:1748 length:183 start_codon:yes stop_codon:yes gene_type:complete